MESPGARSRLVRILNDGCIFARSCVRVLEKRPFLLLMAISIRIVLMTITPLSTEFVALTRTATTEDLSYSLSAGSFSFWVLFLRAIYGLWLICPVDHADVWNSIGFWHYTPSLGMNLLVLLLKTPILLADIFTAPVIYKILKRVGVPRGRAEWGIILWLMNPLVILMGEMGGAPDVVAIFLLMVSIYALIRKRVTLSGIVLFVSFLVKPYSLLVAPLYLIAVRRKMVRRDLWRFALFYVSPTAAVVLLSSIFVNAALFQGIFAGQPTHWYFLGSFCLPFYIVVDSTTVLTIVLSSLLVVGMYYDLWRVNLDNFTSCVLVFLLSTVVLSHWDPYFLLWIAPFIILEHIISSDGRLFIISFTGVALAWTIIYYGYYFASAGNSVFFIPNLSETMTWASSALYFLRDQYWTQSLNVAILLRSAFAGICLAYMVKSAGRNTSFLTRRIKK